MRKKSKKYEHIIKSRNAAFLVSEAGMNILLKKVAKNKKFEDHIKKGTLSSVRLTEKELFSSLELSKNAYKLSAEIKFERDQYIFDPSDETCGFSPAEIKGTVVLTASAKYRGTLSTIRRRFPFSVVSPCVPVVSAFTLFMPSAGIFGPEFFNVCNNSIDGTAITKSILPMVLKSGKKDSKIPAGLIYMGESRVNLNIAAGPSSFGEDFMFYNLSHRKRPVYFINSQPPELLLVPQNPSSYFPSQAWHILHTFHGFYASDSSVKESGMQRQSEYDTYYRNFNLPGRTGAESSWFRLFGTPTDISMTKIYGNTYARFAMLSALGIDVDSSFADENSRGISGMDIDAVAAFLPMISKKGFNECKKEVPGFPFKPFSQIYKNRNDSTNGILKNIFVDINKLSYSKIFKNFNKYSRYMTRIVEDMPFNCMSDFMKYSALIDSSKISSTCETRLELKSKDDDTRGIYFSGPVFKADPSMVLKKIQRYYSNCSDFLKAHVRDNKLFLGCCAYINDKEMTLPQNLEVAKGGIIINEQGFHIRGIQNNTDIPLSLVAVNGNIVIHPFSGPVEAGLVILSKTGRLVSAGNLSKGSLRIKGHLYVPIIDPFEFKTGGILEYDPAFYPLDLNSKSLVLHFSEKSNEVEVIK